MPALIRAIALIVPLLLAITGIAQAQQATLIIHNNTDATLSVFTQNAHSSSIQSQPVVVPPLSRGQATVPMGQSVILAEAINMTGTPDANWSYNFHHSGAHELEIFASNFGMSVMFDAPSSGSAASPPQPSDAEWAALQSLGVLEEPTRGAICEGDRVDPTYYLVNFVNNCPTGYITRGRHPPGSSQARWCAYCGAGYASRLDRTGCCVPNTE